MTPWPPSNGLQPTANNVSNCAVPAQKLEPWRRLNPEPLTDETRAGNPQTTDEVPSCHANADTPETNSLLSNRYPFRKPERGDTVAQSARTN